MYIVHLFFFRFFLDFSTSFGGTLTNFFRSSSNFSDGFFSGFFVMMRIFLFYKSSFLTTQNPLSAFPKRKIPRDSLVLAPAHADTQNHAVSAKQFISFWVSSFIEILFSSHGLSKESELFEFCFLDEFGIGQSLSRDHRKHFGKTCVVGFASVIESECLFVQVAGQVRHITTGIRAAKRTFEQAPEVFNAVRVDLPSDVFGCVVNVLVNVITHTLIGWECISHEARARLHVSFFLETLARCKLVLLSQLDNLPIL